MPSEAHAAAVASNRSATTSDRDRARSLAERWGWEGTSFQTLTPGFSYFFDGDDACVAYVDTGGAWVAAGAPFAQSEQLERVALAFVRAAREHGRRARFFGTEPRFAEHAPAFRSIVVGEQPIWDPRMFADALKAHRSLREQLRRARAKGVSVRELTSEQMRDAQTRDAILDVKKRWLAGRGMTQMSFIVRCEPFATVEHRDCFAAEANGRIVAFASVLPVPAQQGYFLDHLLRDPSAPNGTAELLVDTVMRWASERGAPYLTLGLAPLSGDVLAPLRKARRASRALYDFEGLRRFREKLRPTRVMAIHLSFPREEGALLPFVDALAAFAGGSFLRFAVASIFRGPLIVLRALALLLPPWTLMIALANAERWFGSATVKWSWVLFDALLSVALHATLRKPTARALKILASVVTADVMLTCIQAIAINIPNAKSALDVAVTLIGCAAPTLAAIVLWGAHRRLRVLEA